MKQFRIFSLMILGSLVLGACSTSNEVVGGGIFQKRKYTGGVYWDRTEKLKTTKDNGEEEFDIFRSEEENQRKYVSTTTIRTDAPADYVTTDLASASVDGAENLNASTKTTETVGTVVAVEENTTEQDVQAPVKKKTAKQLSKKNSNVPADSDVMLILLVILAIIIPPLAVFIYEGASTRFIIDLILAILGWGAFGIFGGIFWLCGLAAIIYALLIVLGVI
jgi:uncharacterized membrane protein YqaE (UPF0057 family)